MNNLYRCVNPDCRPTNVASGYDFEAKTPKCPKCNLESTNVVRLTLTHLIVADPTGPIVGMFGKKFRCACDAAKVSAKQHEGFTGERLATNCPACLGNAPTEPVIVPVATKAAKTPANDPAG